jgi:hypothetical protein
MNEAANLHSFDPADAKLLPPGANVLSRAWDDVRSVRESDKLLVLLESEASRLQNLIHRYINQPSQEVLTQILELHGEVLSTLRNRGAADPVLSGSADELRRSPSGSCKASCARSRPRSRTPTRTT